MVIGIGVPFSFRSGSGGGPSVNNDFVIEVDTTQAGSASDTIILPLLSGGTYLGTIDWGDTSTSSLSYANRSHTYAAGGTYTISISGQIEGWRFNNAGDKLKITNVSNWGTLTLNSVNGFFGCNNMTITATDAPTLSATNCLQYIFRDCGSLVEPDFSNWDVSTQTTAQNAFYNCSSLTTPSMNSWDVSNILSFQGMFQGCELFNADITSWVPSSATNMSSMFSGYFGSTSFNQPIGGWDVSNVQLFGGMFTTNIAFNQDLSGWNTSSATNMSNMFNGAVAFNGDITTWDVSSVTTMSNMFRGALAFNQPIGSWTTTSLTLTQSTFFQARAFNQSLNGWDMNGVTLANGMFQGADSFNQPLNAWDTSTITNMASMFAGYFNTTIYDQDISSWDINQVTSFVNFMGSSTGLSTANYDALLIAWDAQGAMSFSGTANFGGSTYTLGGAAEAARTSLIAKWGGIIDGGGV